MYAMLATRAEVCEALRSTSEALGRSLPGGSMFYTDFLGPCSTQAVASGVRGGVGGGGYVKVLANETPTEQL
jgi:hypothetical protein